MTVRAIDNRVWVRENTSSRPKIILELLDSNSSRDTKKGFVIKPFDKVGDVVLELNIPDVFNIIYVRV
jgi:hypothetical protein